MLLAVIFFLTSEKISIQPEKNLLIDPVPPQNPAAELPVLPYQPHPSEGEAPHGIFCSDSKGFYF